MSSPEDHKLGSLYVRWAEYEGGHFRRVIVRSNRPGCESPNSEIRSSKFSSKFADLTCPADGGGQWPFFVQAVILDSSPDKGHNNSSCAAGLASAPLIWRVACFCTGRASGTHFRLTVRNKSETTSRFCHPREGGDPVVTLDSRLRGNDETITWSSNRGLLQTRSFPRAPRDFELPPSINPKRHPHALALPAASFVKSTNSSTYRDCLLDGSGQLRFKWSAGACRQR